MKLLQSITLIAFAISIIACKKESGTFKTAKGYEYTIHQKGSGAVAKTGDYVFYTITSTTDAGKVLQEVTDPEASQPIKLVDPTSEEGKQNIWLEAFAKAQVGDSMTLIMPIDSMPMAYPDPSLEGAKAMHFNIAIKKILDEKGFEELQKKKQEEMAVKAEAGKQVAAGIASTIVQTIADVKSGKLKTTDLSDGVKVFLNEAGSGAKGADGKIASVNYYGVLENGTMFDNSFERGQEFSFPIGQGQVIKGWDVALANLKEGDKATVFIPAAAAYGEQGSGSIPGNSPLVFYIEVNGIK